MKDLKDLSMGQYLKLFDEAKKEFDNDPSTFKLETRYRLQQIVKYCNLRLDDLERIWERNE